MSCLISYKVGPQLKQGRTITFLYMHCFMFLPPFLKNKKKNFRLKHIYIEYLKRKEQTKRIQYTLDYKTDRKKRTNYRVCHAAPPPP